MKKLFQIVIGILIVAGLTSYTFPPKKKINWISVQELAKIYNNAPRPLLIDVYTDWCGWCKKMEKDTYSNPKLVEYVNSHFYAVKLNAEDKNTLTFNGRNYSYNRMSRSNMLAVALLNNQMEFPSTVFMSAINSQPALIAGYLTTKEIEAPIKYFGDPENLKISFQEFNQGFKNQW